MVESALIVGAGSGLSAAVARLLAKEGLAVTLAARRTDKLAALVAETGAGSFTCDASDPGAVAALFAGLGTAPDLVIYNPSYRQRGSITELDPAEVLKALMISCYGGFLVGQQAARLMLARGHGTILFTGASASVKGYAKSAPFAMGKFGLRGLSQSMARELGPQNIHVAHIVIDGGIAAPGRSASQPDALLDADAIALSYLALHRQHRSAWSAELELRPWTETF